MLDAFITPAKREWLSSLLGRATSHNNGRQTSRMQRLDNIVLFSPGVYRVFSEGDLRLGPEDPVKAAKRGKENSNQVVSTSTAPLSHFQPNWFAVQEIVQ